MDEDERGKTIDITRSCLEVEFERVRIRPNECADFFETRKVAHEIPSCRRNSNIKCSRFSSHVTDRGLVGDYDLVSTEELFT